MMAMLKRLHRMIQLYVETAHSVKHKDVHGSGWWKENETHELRYRNKTYKSASWTERARAHRAGTPAPVLAVFPLQKKKVDIDFIIIFTFFHQLK